MEKAEEKTSENGSTAKKAEVEAIAEAERHLEETLEKLILDTPLNKYDVILLARRWA